MTAPRRHRVATLIRPGMAPLEPAVAAEFFGCDRTEDTGVAWYAHRFFAEQPGRLAVRWSPDVFVEHGLEAIRWADTVIVPGWDDRNVAPSEALVSALRAAHRRGARLVSFCTGAYALAHAGLLDGRRATTHWGHAEEFATRFPLVRLEPSVLYVDEGDVLTSAGSAASIDLALHVIRSDHGAEVANIVARDMVVPPHRDGGQAQYIDRPIAPCDDQEPLAVTLDWALGRLDEPLSVEDLAAHALMSPRTFARQFRAVTGTTPHQWISRQRLALAQSLLETSQSSIDEIAATSGFGTAASLRLHFQRTLHTTPQAYRRTFACAEGAA